MLFVCPGKPPDNVDGKVWYFQHASKAFKLRCCRIGRGKCRDKTKCKSNVPSKVEYSSVMHSKKDPDLDSFFSNEHLCLLRAVTDLCNHASAVTSKMSSPSFSSKLLCFSLTSFRIIWFKLLREVASVVKVGYHSLYGISRTEMKCPLHDYAWLTHTTGILHTLLLWIVHFLQVYSFLYNLMRFDTAMKNVHEQILGEEVPYLSSSTNWVPEKG